jgi:hypothetical protein
MGRDSGLFQRSNALWQEVWKRYGKKRVFEHSIRHMKDTNVELKRTETILSDGINTYFLFSLLVLYGLGSGT